MRPMSKPTFSRKNDSPIKTRRKANGISTSAKARKNDQNGYRTAPKAYPVISAGSELTTISTNEKGSFPDRKVEFWKC